MLIKNIFFILLILHLSNSRKEITKEYLENLDISTLPKNYGIPEPFIDDSSFLEMAHQSFTRPENEIAYVSTTGTNTTDCSSLSPCNIAKAFSLLSKKAKSVLYFKEGTYDLPSGKTLSFSGTPDKYIIISSAPSEKVTLTSSKVTQSEHPIFRIEGSYIIIENLIFSKLSGKAVYGIIINDPISHIIIRKNTFSEIKTSKVSEDYEANAILLLGEDRAKSINHVIIYKNIVKNNVIGYSEAVSISSNCEYVYAIQNFIENNTNIGLDFYGNAGYCPTPQNDQPRYGVAIYNYVTKSISPYASCAGIYVDGARDILIHKNLVEDSMYGIEIGAEEPSKTYFVKNIYVDDNTVKANQETGIRIGGYEKGSSTGWVKNTLISDNTVTCDDFPVIASQCDGIYFKGNDISGYKYLINFEFSNNYTKNFVLEDFPEDSYFQSQEKKMSLSAIIKTYGKKPYTIPEDILEMYNLLRNKKFYFLE